MFGEFPHIFLKRSLVKNVMRIKTVYVTRLTNHDPWIVVLLTSFNHILGRVNEYTAKSKISMKRASERQRNLTPELDSFHANASFILNSSQGGNYWVWWLNAMMYVNGRGFRWLLRRHCTEVKFSFRRLSSFFFRISKKTGLFLFNFLFCKFGSEKKRIKRRTRNSVVDSEVIFRQSARTQFWMQSVRITGQSARMIVSITTLPCA
jgi:hypothetical protein